MGQFTETPLAPSSARPLLAPFDPDAPAKVEAVPANSRKARKSKSAKDPDLPLWLHPSGLAAMTASATLAELQEVVQAAAGASGLLEFTRFDAGEILRKEHGGEGPKILRLVVGNPLIMKEMARTVPDAASYAPVTILIDERDDGMHLSYDSTASLLAPYESPEASSVARDLDAKVEQLLETAGA